MVCHSYGTLRYCSRSSPLLLNMDCPNNATFRKILFIVLCVEIVFHYMYYLKPLQVYHSGKGDFSLDILQKYATKFQPDSWNLDKCPPINVSVMNITSNFTRVALLSYPGSGNTWTRHLLQQLTGTVYCDSVLRNGDFPGECIKPTDTTKGCIVYKSHRYTKESVRKYDKAIILIRNPFDSIKTFFNFLFGSKFNITKGNVSRTHDVQKRHGTPERFKKNGDLFHAAVLKSQFNSSTWRKFILQEANAWQTCNRFWLETFKDKHLLIKYEDLKQNLIFTLRRISKFLNVEVTEHRYQCVKRNQEGNYHRKQNYKLGIKEIYTNSQIHTLNKAISYVKNITTLQQNLETYLFN